MPDELPPHAAPASAAEPVVTDRMSDFEALMWQLEKSPLLANTMANVTILDRPPDRRRFQATMRSAVQKVPRLHSRAVPAPGRLANPMWVDDPEFDLDHHLRWVNLGGHGTRDDLYEFVATITRQPFDRERPLWDFVIVEGLEGGRAAMVQRMHHTITDGEGGIRLSVAFLDLERTPEDTRNGRGDATTNDPGNARPTEAGSGDHTADGATADGATADGATGDEATADEATTDGATGREAPGEPTMLGEAARALGHTVRTRSGQLVGAIGSAGNMARHPTDAAEFARSAARQVVMPNRCSPLWTQRSLQRWYGTTTLDLARVKEAAHALGGSVNDFFVAGAAAGAAAYHVRHGAPVEHLRVSMPISVRHGANKREPADGAAKADAMAGGNAFSPAQTLLPTSPIDPAAQFRAVHDTLGTAKAERALGVVDGAAPVLNLLPTAALVATGERATASVDFVVSNVRAAPFDLYIAGALMEANYPVGPLAGTAFNITTMSYRGQLFIGLHVDPVAVEDPAGLLADIDAAYDALFAAAGDGRR